MKKVLLIAAMLLCILPSFSYAQTINQKQEFIKGKVTEVKKDELKDINGRKNPYQQVVVTILEGNDKGKTKNIDYGGQVIISNEQKLKSGDTVILSVLHNGKDVSYVISDKYRLPSLLLFALLFFGIILVTTGKKGLGSISGLVISLLIIVTFIIPQILGGADPLLISIIGSIAIMIITIYLAHGFNQMTTIAVVSTAVSLFLTGVLAIVAVKLSGLSGLGTEDAYNLLLGSKLPINLQGLLLGGIIIGSLGVLDDTTTTQSSTITQLSAANPSYSVKELYRRGMIIGKEHISSLVNTLVLAYAGTGIGIFIFIILSLQNQTYPWWVIFNSEVLAEEIIRTLAGSIGLILAVPITTIIAAFLAKNEIKIK